MGLWDMISELYSMLEAGEIEDSEEVDVLDDSFDASRFIKDMHMHVSETDDMATQELTERQIATITQLWEGYANGNWQPLEEYL